MIYLNYAALSPTHPEAEQAVQATLDEFKTYLYSEAGLQWYLRKVRECRARVAKLLNVNDPSALAFVSNASTAHYLTIRSLRWQRGDSIVTTTHENPSITRQLRALEHQGVRIHAIHPSSPDMLVQAFGQALDHHSAKAIVLSHVSHVDGRILPIQTISALARKRGVMCIVDGAQAVGHIPVDLSQFEFDVYFFTGHKWCAGPLGTGAMVVNDRFLNSGSTCAVQIFEGNTPQATQFEIGTHNIGLIAGLAQACERIVHEGLSPAKLQWFRREAKELIGKHAGMRIVEWDGPQAPGILTIQGKPDIDHRGLTQQLAEASQVIVKPFVDYPQDVIPAIRLSWDASLNEQDFRLGLEKIAEGFS